MLAVTDWIVGFDGDDELFGTTAAGWLLFV
jgi:hypothetical protein